jgi:hypothetical protein
MLGVTPSDGVHVMVDAVRAGGRAVHFVRYLPDQRSAVYRRTADPSHARLTVANVPANISDRAVEIVVNLVVFAAPFGVRCVIDYSRLNRNRLTVLFASRANSIVLPGNNSH